jgi:hypothetical protein
MFWPGRQAEATGDDSSRLPVSTHGLLKARVPEVDSLSLGSIIRARRIAFVAR